LHTATGATEFGFGIFFPFAPRLQDTLCMMAHWSFTLGFDWYCTDQVVDHNADSVDESFDTQSNGS
jgi:hypothetical protein